MLFIYYSQLDSDASNELRININVTERLLKHYLNAT